MTLRQPSVQDALASFEIVKVDVDALADRELCRRYRRSGAVPEFAILAADGVVQHRWTGALPAEELVAALQQPPPPPPAEDKAGVDRHRELAEYYIRCSDNERIAEQLEAIRQLDPSHSSGALAEVLWLHCETLHDHGRYPALAASAERYLATFPNGSHAPDANILLGVARVETGGDATPELRRHVDELIDVLKTPFPGGGILGRAADLLGVRSKPTREEANRWVDRANATMDRLTNLGRAASPRLREAMLGDDPVAVDKAARVLGRMRLPETRGFLLEQCLDTDLSARHRKAIATCMSAHGHPDFLDHLVATLGSETEVPAVREEAAHAIRSIVVGDGGTARADVARAVAAGLEHGNSRLRLWCLQLASYVHAPLPLELLLELLADRRATFFEFRICDNALWILCQQIDKQIVDADGEPCGDRCTPELVEFLRRWHASVGANLRWDPAKRCYRVK